MISAIVCVPDAMGRGPARDGELVVRSLVWLVSAVVSGIVRDVTLTGSPDLGLADIADQSGCGVVEGAQEAERLRRALAESRGPRVLLMLSAFQPGETMIGELDGLTRSLAGDAAARLLAAPATLRQRMFPRAAPTVGLFASAERFRALPAARFSRLATALGPTALFATRAVPIL